MINLQFLLIVTLSIHFKTTKCSNNEGLKHYSKINKVNNATFQLGKLTIVIYVQINMAFQHIVLFFSQ